MCGIAGFIDYAGETDADQLSAIAADMAGTLRHRGPDDKGTWVDQDTGIALGFQRLSILDLSPLGRQPMVSADGRYVIVYNGEVYNFLELRQQLESLGHSFRGNSDTEVLLAAFVQWGVRAAVERFNGMFALALWDHQDRCLYLVRDRLGIKPLYYGWANRQFIFASELKAVRQHPAFSGEIDRRALTLYLRHNCVPAPYSIYQGFYKLPPGTILRIDAQHLDRETNPQPYWSAKEVVERGSTQPFAGSEKEAVAELNALLKASVKQRMISDVPLGAFLSGGIDSSLIVALMQTQSDRPVKTFSIGFHEAEFDEARYAKKVAHHLGTDHTEHYLTPEETRAVIPLLPTLYDEPFSDSSQIPTYLISKLARQQVTVSLSGDGGDELFGGYNRYYWIPKAWRGIAWMPHWLRSLGAKTINTLLPKNWNHLLSRFTPDSLADSFPIWLLNKLPEIGETLRFNSPEEIYTHFTTHWGEASSVVIKGNEPPLPATNPQEQPREVNLRRWMMFHDMVTYLPNDILAKVDRASMGVSLEVRAPLLDDHRVAEFAAGLPTAWLYRDGHGKWLLRQLLYKYVPRDLVDRPKMGFSVPLGEWLAGPLRDWAESLIDEQRLQREGYFRPEMIRIKWNDLLRNRGSYEHEIWDILMFQAWLSENVHPH